LIILGVLMVSSAAAAQPALPPPDLGGGKSGTGAPAPAAGDTVQPVKPPPQVTISAQVSSANVSRDDIVTLIIKLTWQETAQETAPPLDFDFPQPPSAEGLTLFGNSFRSETTLLGNMVEVTRTYLYEFRADQEGPTEIGAVTVNYGRAGSELSHTIQTQPIPVTVTKPGFAPGALVRKPAAMAIIVLVMAAAAAGLVIPALRKRRAEKKAEPELQKSAYDIARERIKQVDRLRMAGDYRDFLVRLSKELIRYLDTMMDARVSSMSSQGVAETVGAELGGKWKERMTEFLDLCDRVKFGGYLATGPELDEAMHTASDLIEEMERRYPQMNTDK